MKERLLASGGLLLAALAAAGSPASTPEADRAGVTPAAEGPVDVTWSELADLPCLHHGSEVRFRIQVQGRLDRWRPGPTRFGPGAYAAVAAWADEQFPWDEAEFENPRVRVFVRRGAELDRTLASARAHQRFEVRGIVREVWNDRPWVELVAVKPLPEEIGEASVFHAARALERMADGAFQLAEEALQQALSAPLPAHAREELGRLRTICAAEIADPKPTPIRPRKR
ncbi:MAG: hypothetical protein JNK02_00635 [Planctomycetes bacterium]|nr:hypothetical protein [Planctomycetota bacterium]